MRPNRGLLAILAAAVPNLADAAPPLPPAPIRLVIQDASAFDTALTGRFRDALTGHIPEGEPVFGGFRASRIGSKLEDQWGKLSKDLPWTWTEIHRLRPSAVGVAILDVGALEGVVVIETPLATLPIAPPKGVAKTHEGIAYNVVAPGAADAAPDPTRRAGLAWSRDSGRLILATSERAMRLALDATRSASAQPRYLDGLVALDLDMDVLSADRYFRREFLFGDGGLRGHVRAALRLEDGTLIEVREGSGGVESNAATFEGEGAAAMGWSARAGFLDALRGGLLEPVPSPSKTPLVSRAALPSSMAEELEDRYAVRLDKPRLAGSATGWEEGELAAWRALLEAQPVPGFGYRIGHDGTRLLAFPWPATRDADIARLIRATVQRRAARLDESEVDGAREIRVGPSLPAIAWKRTGAFLWIGPSAAALAGVSEPRVSNELLRWGRLDLEAVSAETRRWESAEGPATPESVRPFSDRILGLLGWMPHTRAISVERKRTPSGWIERVVFESESR
jgi:hypothetical protein